MELTEQASYRNKKLVQRVKNNAAGYRCYTLPVGLSIYRGESGGRKEPGSEVPAFFSDMVSAAIYTRGNPANLFAYKVHKSPNLFELSYFNLAKLYEEEERLTLEERQALDMYLQVADSETPYIVPVAFLKKENLEGEHKLYLNRRIINIVCRLGYDGWIAMPESLLQRNMDTQYYAQTGQVRFKLNLYNPEIALCKWDDFVEKLPSGANTPIKSNKTKTTANKPNTSAKPNTAKPNSNNTKTNS